MILRAFRYRLYPTKEQAAAMAQTADAVRFVYNLALEQRRDFWRQAQTHGLRLNFVSQGHQVTQLRREADWLARVSLAPLTQALRDLDKAFADFFAKRKSYPGFRRKDRSMSFRHQGRDVNVREASARFAQIWVPKVGWVKLRLSRAYRGKIVSATFRRDDLGWHVSLTNEVEHLAANPLPKRVGIDRGVANTVALSTGEILATPATNLLERKRKKAQRLLARRQRGSGRYRKQQRRLSRITAKIARLRADWRHRTTTDIARRFGVAVMEDLNIVGMTRSGQGKRGLNRSVLAQGWGAFAAVLAYKLEERGGTLVKVNPAYTSQTCSACGTIDKASRESQASFACRHCGFVGHADTNAAINILRRSTAVVEGSGCAPVEARTQALAA